MTNDPRKLPLSDRLYNKAKAMTSGPDRVFVADMSRLVKELEESLTQEKAATQYWYGEVERLRQELREANAGGYLGD